MPYPPPIIRDEYKVLEVIDRGHPDRMKTVTRGGVSAQIATISTDEIQVAVNMPFDDVMNCIAHLVAHQYITSGEERPGFFASMRGAEPTYYYWATLNGSQFLRDHKEQEIPEVILPPEGEEMAAGDIDDAVRVYENSFSASPYVEPGKIEWAARNLDADVKEEIEAAALQLEDMWAEYEERFGHRSAASSDEEMALRDPAVTLSVVRVYRAKDEQLRRRGFPPSEKPGAWHDRYQGGDVDLPTAPWE